MSSFDPSERDELVSSYLDGEASADERALVQGDPDLLARADFLGQITAMVRAPVDSPADATLEAHIAAALEASATSSTVTSVTPTRHHRPAARVADASRRRQRANWRPEIGRIASIAAAIAVIALAIPLLFLGRDTGGDDDAALTQATDTAGGEVAAADSAETARALEVADTAAATASAEGSVEAESDSAPELDVAPTGGAAEREPVIDLGRVRDRAGISRRLAALNAPQLDETEDDQLLPCRAELVAALGPVSASVTFGTAIVAGRDIVFVSAETEPTTLVVVGADTCLEVDLP